MNLPDNMYSLGDACLCWSFGEGIDPATSHRVIEAYRSLKACDIPGVLDVVPSYTALAVHFDPAGTDRDELVRTVSGLIREARGMFRKEEIRTHDIPVVYDGEDLSGLAEGKGLTVGEVVRIHSGGIYTVAMIGFRPHFPYLLGMDARLETPRLESPRLRVPAGSVGIGGKQTGIYPDESPGGWNLIGRTVPSLLTAIRVGDTVRFRSVSAL
jgi:inhibitor of KinA